MVESPNNQIKYKISRRGFNKQDKGTGPTTVHVCSFTELFFASYFFTIYCAILKNCLAFSKLFTVFENCFNFLHIISFLVS